MCSSAANALSVCNYVLGSTQCSDSGVLVNLTMLAEPHLFEHDNSMSRPDYNYDPATKRELGNNANFEGSAFQVDLTVAGPATHVDYSLMNEIRLQRASNSLKNDVPSWYEFNKGTTATEVSATSNSNFRLEG